MPKNFMVFPFILASLLIFSGCATKGTQQDTSFDSDMESMADNIEQFYNADPKDVIRPYLKIIGEVISIDDENILCADEYLSKLNHAITLNPSSLVANTLVGYCVTPQLGEDNSYIYKSGIIALLLAQSGNGESLESAIKVRELSEIELLFTASDYTIFDQEIVPNGDKFAFKVSVVDNETGKFEYRFVDNFRVLSPVVRLANSKMSDLEVTKTLFTSFGLQKLPPAVNTITSKFMEKKNYELVIKLISEMEERSPLMTLNLARAYLNDSQFEEVESLLDELFEASDLGFVPATIFIARMMLTIDNSEFSRNDVVEMLKLLDKRLTPNASSLLLADTFWANQQYELAEYWYEYSIAQGNEAARTSLLEKLKRKAEMESSVNETLLKTKWKDLM